MNKLLITAFFPFMIFHAYAADGVFVQYGAGNQAEMTRLGGLWKWDRKWTYGDDWRISGYWEVTLGRWIGLKSNDNNQTVWEVGLTPVFRMERVGEGEGVRPYLEGGFIGMHLISPTFIYSGRKFGSAFEFGNHVGVGVRFGDQHRYDLGLRFQHLSNANIKQPNQGINFFQAHFIYHF